jgi:prepilin-type processing-associated H-X9-DG protein
MLPGSGQSRRTAFTQVELLVVFALISLLAGLLVPALQSARIAANRIQCANNLKQVGLACHAYHCLKGRLPPGYAAFGPYVDGNSDTAPGWGWAVYLLPFLEQEGLYHQIDLTKPVETSTAPQVVLKMFLCPADTVPIQSFLLTDIADQPICAVAPSTYAASCGPAKSDVSAATGLGVFYRNSATRFTDISDGTSQTIMIGERAWSQSMGAWAGVPAGAVTRPGPLNPWSDVTGPATALVLAHTNWLNTRTDPDGGLDDFSSAHRGGVNLLFADGSVHFLFNITETSPTWVDFQSLGTRNAGDVIQTPVD